MKRLVTLTAVLVTVCFATAAFAQDGGGDDDQRSKFYNFDDMTVDGEIKTPDLVKTQARGKAKFKRLLELKKSFLPKVKETTKSEALEK